MAKSELFSRHAVAPLREILWSSQIDSLPEEVQKSEAFLWLLRRDDSRSPRANFERNEYEDQDYHQLFRRLSKSGECDRQTLSQLLKPIAKSLLAPLLQTRYEQAIDIGIRWRNASNRYRWAQSSNVPDNFEMTVAANLKGFEARGTQVAEDEFRTVFYQFLQDAGESADRELGEVQAEWRRWEQQVTNLREDLVAVENELNDLEPTSALIYAWLRFSIIRESYGSSERSSAFEIGPLFFTFFVSMFADRRHWRHSAIEFHEINRMLNMVINEKRYGLARRRQLAQLEEKCRIDDPFDAYAPLKRPADQELLTLVQEHMLVDGEPSPFLKRWLDRLTHSGYTGVNSVPLPYRSKIDSEAVDTAGDWADSKIKHAIGSPYSSRLPQGWETVSECCRRIWVDDWVKWVVDNLTSREQKTVDPRWTKNAVFEFIEAVRTRLVSQGYSFDALSDDEKAAIWNS
ncbi:MAG: hypothetical protein R3B84_10730 [Zavarzinella sp.]